MEVTDTDTAVTDMDIVDMDVPLPKKTRSPPSITAVITAATEAITEVITQALTFTQAVVTEDIADISTVKRVISVFLKYSLS